MFGIGFGELLVLVFIGVVILGPKRCVEATRSAGKTLGKIKKEWHDIKSDLSADESSE